MIQAVRQYLATHHMPVEDEWISGCVEFLTEDTNTSYSENEIKTLAKEQWLLNDLKDICPGSLPANLKSQTKTVLDGRFVLQINAAVDIGTPAYQQYLKLQKVNMENVEATTKFEDKISNHRMIKLYLTDGVQDITAIEYKPMRNLSCDITPGSKVLIKGPIECRRGMLFLMEGSVELLGGEVQEMAVTNSLAGLLSAKLGLPLSQDTDPNTTISHPRNTNIPTPHTDVPPLMPPNESFESTREPMMDQRPVARVTSIQVASFNDDDDVIDVDQLAAIEAQITENPAKRSLNEGSSSNPVKKLKMEATTSLIKIHPTPNTNLMPTINKIEDYPDDNDLVFEEDEDYLREIEAKIDAKEGLHDKGPISISAEPFVYIKQINEMTSSEKAGRVFNVKGQIMKLLSKLFIGKDGWSLKCTIVDGTGSIDVDFTSDVLSKLLGFTPQEMKNLNKQIANNPELNQKAVSALQKAKESLQVLYCIIELTMLEVPKITCLTPYEAQHVEALRKRIESTGL